MAEDCVILSCGSLCATVLTPDSSLYRRTRFVRAGMISRVSVEGVCFTQTERDQPESKSTGGMGLCCEYKCPELEQAAAIGAEWLKPGVGVLKREQSPWSHLDERQVEPLPCEWKVQEDAIDIATWAGPLNGVAYREERRVQALDHALRLDVVLHNTGDKPLSLLEYCHNFLSLGQTSVDERYRLLLPCVKNPAEIAPGDTLSPTRDGVRWSARPTQAFFRPFLPTHEAKPSWRLEMEGTSLAVSEEDSFSPDWLSLWGDSYCVCPEVYQRLSVPPGGEARWSRIWRFYTR